MSQSNDTSSDNMVLFEIYPDLKEEDFDLLIMYLESKKQSGGGDIINIENLTFDSLQSKRSFRIAYQDPEAKERVLSKKFFKFKNYDLKSYQPNILGYKHDKYDLNKSKLIIKDILVQDNSDEDDSIVQMYAEHLAPDNEITHIQKSNLFANTFYITYKDELDKDQLKCRYNKKPKLRNKQINLLDSFETKSFLIASNSKQTNAKDFEKIKSKIIEEIEKREPVNYFFDLNDKFILFQIQNEMLLNDLADSVRLSLKNLGEGFVLELVYNFELLQQLTGQVACEETKTEPEKKFVDIGVQTEPIQEPKRQKKRIFKNSQASSIRSSISESESEKVKSSSSQYSSISHSSSISNKENFQKTNPENSCFTLDPEEYYTVALLNTKQIFLNFENELKKLDKQLELRIDNRNQVSILNRNQYLTNNDWKLQVMNKINQFFTSRTLYRQIEIPDEISKNENFSKKLADSLAEYNKLSSAYYFRIQNKMIHGYGCKNALNQKISALDGLFREILSGKISKQPSPAPSTTVASQSLKDNQNNVITQAPKLIYEIEPSSLVSKVLLNIKQIMSDFRNNIKNFNAEVVTQNEGKNILITCTNRAQDPVEWIGKIKSFVADFEKSQISKRIIEIPKLIRSPKELNDLKVHLKRFFEHIPSLKYEIQNGTILAYGYSKVVENFDIQTVAKFKNLENNIRDRIKTKLDVKINYKKKPLEFSVLNRFNGIYLKEFSNGLKTLNATVERFNNNNKENSFQVKCTLDQNALKNEPVVEAWRNKINSYINSFFRNFRIKLLKLTIEATKNN